ncbi:anthranilate phosphoribosyltransferase [Candidatus Desantisbacteria bacterium CG1_02_38_46]|uniref:Anthranilate phosphoribosyltransferase n=2 Tax=unclassified Candidatus Desantisiibacteriota TaxID=3106372 RepID=A0A1J4SED5_9BACT|nr:MAG: anthranilate phosphoribosyltransferase [Candidatus Desantisbacteria bacterium CG1_02_38_46]PIU51096.1 MAG: anthranilate phosphoribosyltransferase [Candidatus Desantisbacteria bacterium CG07_land_8_20_14_0_80_39_15]
MIKEAIAKVVKKENLTEEEAIGTMREIMEGTATPAQIASFITALRMKGETVEEITGCAKVMREKATRINIDREIIVDTCGTGGDETHTFNISTAAAFVVAGAGLIVAKHGNRSVSSQCGSADVLMTLGVNLDVPAEKVKQCIEKIGIGFLYAPLFHSAMKFALGPRREIGIRTIFNILGPLTNPAGANVQVLGVYNPDLTQPIAMVLKNLGSKSAFVVYGEGSPHHGESHVATRATDEISITGRTKISQLKDGNINTYYIQPEDFGLKRAKLEDIKGGDAKKNAQIIIDLFTGMTGPKQDVVLMNSAAIFVAAEKAKTFEEGIEIGKNSIKSGSALEKLEDLIKFSKE